MQASVILCFQNAFYPHNCLFLKAWPHNSTALTFPCNYLSFLLLLKRLNPPWAPKTVFPRKFKLFLISCKILYLFVINSFYNFPILNVGQTKPSTPSIPSKPSTLPLNPNAHQDIKLFPSPSQTYIHSSKSSKILLNPHSPFSVSDVTTIE